jgi:hypothetical protein
MTYNIPIAIDLTPPSGCVHYFAKIGINIGKHAVKQQLFYVLRPTTAIQEQSITHESAHKRQKAPSWHIVRNKHKRALFRLHMLLLFEIKHYLCKH